MVVSAKLVFHRLEVKEYDQKDGTKKAYYYGYFTQDEGEVEFIKVSLLPDQKLEKYQIYNLKLNIVQAKFKNSSTGQYVYYLSCKQI